MNESITPQPFFLISWFQRFRYSIVSSITDLNYYVEILNLPFRFTFKTLTWFYLFLSIVITFIFVVKDLPKLSTTLDDIRSEAVSSYPDTLRFDWHDETLTSTAQKPLEVPFPKAVSPLESAPKNFLVIDTSTDQFPDRMNSVFFLNQKNVYINSMENGWTDVPLHTIIDTKTDSLDKSRFLSLAEASKSAQSEMLASLPWLLLLINSFGLFFIRLITTAINAIIVQFFFQILNKPLTYKKVLQLCLHVLIPTELIYQLSKLFFPTLNFPMFGLAFWVIITLVMWHLRHLQVVKFEIEDPSKK